MKVLLSNPQIFLWVGLGEHLHFTGNSGPNCLLAADSFKAGEDMGKAEKKMQKNKCRKTKQCGERRG